MQLSRQGKLARQIALELGVGTVQIESVWQTTKTDFLFPQLYLIISSVQHCVLYLVLYVRIEYSGHNRRAQVQFGNVRLHRCGSFIKWPLL